ncbi:hypothetical protein D5400_16930 [Georhizobium profundi]|uniref:Tip attachment protein J domain-containing protein n=1 Tax=Georhizobium profundi TaxID=2341112 RepID=A0A3Q8XQ39_9HYPH|nr:hypothetical protein [Georhizobium profundi]AZN72734.1 hypothetical protein D5400_16930 [Georhizobium profundi]
MAIFSAIGGVIATSVLGLAAGTSAFAIASATIGGALAFGAKTLVNGYLNRRKSRNYSAVQGEVELGSNVPASTVYGKGKVKGHRIYYAKWGPGDKSNTDVFVLANGWCDGLEPYVYFYGQKHALYEIPPIGNEAKFYGVVGFENIISFRFYDGRPGQLADQRLVSFTANLGNPWKSTSVCAGLTYVIVERFYDEKFGNGRPEIEFVLRGLREYDPRHDSTVAGGEGEQRLDDPSTWVHTQNPAVHRLNYQLGVRGRISNRTIIGEGKSLGQLDLASYFASMNVCDTTIDGKPTYQASLIVTADDDHTEVLKEFDDAMAGYGLNRRGLSGVIAGAPQIPVLEITADDIDMGRAKQIKRRKSAFELYNHISGQFTSIEDQWNPASLTPVYVNADIAKDGRTRQTGNDFLQVTEPDIAQRLLAIRYRQQRLGGKYTVPVSRRVGLKVQEGLWVEAEGLDWLIVGWNCDTQFRFTLDLAETSASVYSDAGIEPGPVVVPSVSPVNPSLISTVANFSVDVGSITGPDGYEIPALLCRWTPPEDPSITEVRFEYVIGSDPAGATVYRDRCDNPEAGEYYITSEVVPFSRHTARATIRTVPDRLKTWTPWQTTADETGPFQVYPPGLIDQVNQSVEELLDWIGNPESPLIPLVDIVQENAAAIVEEATARQEAIQAEAGERIAGAASLAERFRRISNDQANIALLVAEQDFANYEAQEQLRRAIKVESDAITARYTEAITVAISGDGGIATRVQVLEVSSAALGAAISSEQTARITAVDALAQEISLISVGTNQQFDWQTIWNFDSTVEGWDGNGIPVWQGGFLRPADAASDPYVTSPRGIGALGTQYRQLRIGLRKVGSPTWKGFAWWRAAGVMTWSTEQRVSFPEPTFDASNFAVAIINPEWTGTIDQIRLDLSTAADASNYFLIDWVAIGRPSPGASQAALLAEQIARTTADSALAQDIAVLSVQLNDLNGYVAGQATILSDAVTSVEAIDELVTVLASQVDILNAAIPGKADSSVLDELAAEVEALGGGGFVSQARAIRSLRSALDNVALLVAEQDFANRQDSQNALQAVSNAYSTLDTYARAVDGRVDLQARRVDGVIVTLGQKADASVVTSQQAQITAQGNQLNSVAGALTTVQNQIPGLATQTVTNSLDSRITATENVNTSQQSAIVALNNSLTGKADASALSGLSTVVTQQGADINVLSDAVTAVSASVADKADVSAFNSLSAVVVAHDDTLVAYGQSIQSLTASMGGSSAEIRTKFEVQAGPAGYAARYALLARINSGDVFRQAGFFVDVPPDPIFPNRFVVIANQFVVTDGANNRRPFVFEDGVAYLDEIRARAGFIQQLVSEEAFIQNLTVGESNIGFKTITSNNSIASSGSYSGAAQNYVTVAVLDTPKIVGSFLQVDGQITLSTNGAQSSRATFQARIFRVDTQQEVWVTPFYQLVGQNQGPNSFPISIVRDFAMDNSESPGSAGQYVLQIANVNKGGSSTVTWNIAGKFLLWKK